MADSNSPNALTKDSWLVTDCLDSDPTGPSLSNGLISRSAYFHVVSHPDDLFDNNTQMSLIERSEDLHLDDPVWPMLDDDLTQDMETSRKVMKSCLSDDAYSNRNKLSDDGEDDVAQFDATGATASPKFFLNKAGLSMISFGAQESGTNTLNSNVLSSPIINVANSDATGLLTLNTSDLTSEHLITLAPLGMVLTDLSLNSSYPAKVGELELKVLIQPEDQHRARYLTEGSRGAIKDKSGQGYPTVKLLGYHLPVKLLVYIGSDCGKIRPHGFYQACKVSGKNSTECSEQRHEGTTVIELDLLPKDEMTAVIDCVGILKLRNADVEQRIGMQRSKKKSTRARMVFRVNIPKANSGFQTLQVASTPISCTQPAGQPEICRMSVNEGPVSGSTDIFIIGKNFVKGAQVFFTKKNDDDAIEWQEEGKIDWEYFQTAHLIVSTPVYNNQTITKPVHVEVTIVSAGKCSEPVIFSYQPRAPAVEPIKKEDTHNEQEPDKVLLELPSCITANKMLPQTVALGEYYDDVGTPGDWQNPLVLENTRGHNIHELPSVKNLDVEMVLSTGVQPHFNNGVVMAPITPREPNTVQESLQELQQLLEEHRPSTTSYNYCKRGSVGDDESNRLHRHFNTSCHGSFHSDTAANADLHATNQAMLQELQRENNITMASLMHELNQPENGFQVEPSFTPRVQSSHLLDPTLLNPLAGVSNWPSLASPSQMVYSPTDPHATGYSVHDLPDLLPLNINLDNGGMNTVAQKRGYGEAFGLKPAVYHTQLPAMSSKADPPIGQLSKNILPSYGDPQSNTTSAPTATNTSLESLENTLTELLSLIKTHNSAETTVDTHQSIQGLPQQDLLVQRLQQQAVPFIRSVQNTPPAASIDTMAPEPATMYFNQGLGAPGTPLVQEKTNLPGSSTEPRSISIAELLNLVNHHQKHDSPLAPQPPVLSSTIQPAMHQLAPVNIVSTANIATMSNASVENSVGGRVVHQITQIPGTNKWLLLPLKSSGEKHVSHGVSPTPLTSLVTKPGMKISSSSDAPESSRNCLLAHLLTSSELNGVGGQPMDVQDSSHSSCSSSLSQAFM